MFFHTVSVCGQYFYDMVLLRMCDPVCVCVLPSVTQDGGVVKRSPPVAVRLVDVSPVLQQELAGRQGILGRKQEHVS